MIKSILDMIREVEDQYNSNIRIYLRIRRRYLCNFKPDKLVFLRKLNLFYAYCNSIYLERKKKIVIPRGTNFKIVNVEHVSIYQSHDLVIGICFNHRKGFYLSVDYMEL